MKNESLRITYRDITPTPALEATIRRKAAKLARLCERLERCHVVVSYPHAHAHGARHYLVQVQVTVPGAEITAGRDHNEDATHENPYVAVRDAFKAVRRTLERAGHRRRGVGRHREDSDGDPWTVAA